MRKVIASMNVTFDGFCDHTAGIANAELHEYYTDMLNNAGTILYGRTTYQLMEDYWPDVVKNPTGDKHMDDFANAIENISKVLFSRTVKSVTWKNSRLATNSLKDEVTALKQQQEFGQFEPGELESLIAEGEQSIRTQGAIDADKVFSELRQRSATP